MKFSLKLLFLVVTMAAAMFAIVRLAILDRTRMEIRVFDSSNTEISGLAVYANSQLLGLTPLNLQAKDFIRAGFAPREGVDWRGGRRSGDGVGAELGNIYDDDKTPVLIWVDGAGSSDWTTTRGPWGQLKVVSLARTLRASVSANQYDPDLEHLDLYVRPVGSRIAVEDLRVVDGDESIELEVSYSSSAGRLQLDNATLSTVDPIKHRASEVDIDTVDELKSDGVRKKCILRCDATALLRHSYVVVSDRSRVLGRSPPYYFGDVREKLLSRAD